MNLHNFFGFRNNDILGIYDNPTMYEVEGRNALVTYPFADSDKRMEKKGWMKVKGRRVIVYKYPGTLQDFTLELMSVNKKSDGIIRLIESSD
jgi:hypothetical protein